VASRVVLDTNVYVSAYAFGGIPARLMRAAITADFELVTSPAILAEVARVLADKLGFDRPHVEDVVRQLALVAVVVRPRRRLSVIADEPDNRVLECALEADATFVVSGDHHLLDIREFEGIRVLGVTEARDLLCPE
jgi:putative PIN family toxin of toxin-antitoxin system